MSADVHTLAPDMAQVQRDHGHALSTLETRLRATIGNRYGTTSLTRGIREGFWAGIQYALTTQQGIDNLDPTELIHELRLGPGSIYWPVKAEDPRFWAYCPHCETETLTSANGCTDCGYDHNTKGITP
jgi:hypothetical protein